MLGVLLLGPAAWSPSARFQERAGRREPVRRLDEPHARERHVAQYDDERFGRARRGDVARRNAWKFVTKLRRKTVSGRRDGGDNIIQLDG